MAGHIDHGKTTLTKALTNVDTDRLKEEKEREISIEPGFASLYEDDQIQISVVDVPGHERFIRQMIAGVAGIDLVVLVVAADEGVMPQTKEHLEILSFLGITSGIIALTKIDRVEKELHELAREEITEELFGTVFEGAPIVLVDSLSGKGVEEIKTLIIRTIEKAETTRIQGDFRLPIDQVFTVKGQGTVVRGTVYEGMVEEGEALYVLPSGFETRARQIQVHLKEANTANGGQRAAINLSSLAKNQIKRGDVLVKSPHFTVTKTVDVTLHLVQDLQYEVKQRMTVKVHTGTAEVMGRIVFFDRNDVITTEEEIYCQLRLEEPIVTKRNDRFIIRRPTPHETIGGGEIIDPNGAKYKFGKETISKLKAKREGTAEERLIRVLQNWKVGSREEILQKTSLSSEELDLVLCREDWITFSGTKITHSSLVSELHTYISKKLEDFHNKESMKYGINKAELIQTLQPGWNKEMIEYVLSRGMEWKQEGPTISQKNFTPHVPPQWKKRSDNSLLSLKKSGRKVESIDVYLDKEGIPKDLQSAFIHFYREQKMIVGLEGTVFWHREVFDDALKTLIDQTKETFSIGEAKEILGLSRKYVIPFLESLDKRGLTLRDGGERRWKT
ncbi:selenocysteine-specific translation elongation factor [Rossellomorea sp. BNER]|nr:selenocysteine-specific translation elongation factor [Rossellomorea sp. BNER]